MTIVSSGSLKFTGNTDVAVGGITITYNIGLGGYQGNAEGAYFNTSAYVNGGNGGNTYVTINGNTMVAYGGQGGISNVNLNSNSSGGSYSGGLGGANGGVGLFYKPPFQSWATSGGGGVGIGTITSANDFNTYYTNGTYSSGGNAKDYAYDSGSLGVGYQSIIAANIGNQFTFIGGSSSIDGSYYSRGYAHGTSPSQVTYYPIANTFGGGGGAAGPAGGNGGDAAQGGGGGGSSSSYYKYVQHGGAGGNGFIVLQYNDSTLNSNTVIISETRANGGGFPNGTFTLPSSVSNLRIWAVGAGGGGAMTGGWRPGSYYYGYQPVFRSNGAGGGAGGLVYTEYNMKTSSIEQELRGNAFTSPFTSQISLNNNYARELVGKSNTSTNISFNNFYGKKFPNYWVIRGIDSLGTYGSAPTYSIGYDKTNDRVMISLWYGSYNFSTYNYLFDYATGKYGGYYYPNSSGGGWDRPTYNANNDNWVARSYPGYGQSADLTMACHPTNVPASYVTFNQYAGVWRKRVYLTYTDGNSVQYVIDQGSNWAGTLSTHDRDSSGNTYIAAHAGTSYYTYYTGYYFAESRPALIKLDNSGNVLWAKVIDWNDSGGHVEYIDQITVNQTSGNVYVMGGWRTNTSYYRSFVAKFNSSGTLQWAKDLSITLKSYFGGGATLTDWYGATGSYYQGESPYNTQVRIITDSSENVFVAGIVLGPDGYASTNNSIGIMKFNSSGTVQWSKKYIPDLVYSYYTGNEGLPRSVCMDIDSDNNIYLAMHGVGKVPGGTNPREMLYIIKIDNSGNLLFQNRILPSSSRPVRNTNLLGSGFGRYFFVGNDNTLCFAFKQNYQYIARFPVVMKLPSTGRAMANISYPYASCTGNLSTLTVTSSTSNVTTSTVNNASSCYTSNNDTTLSSSFFSYVAANGGGYSFNWYPNFNTD